MINLSSTSRNAIIGAVAFATASMVTAGAVMADRYSRLITFINDYPSSLMYLYATNTDDSNWGKDHLGEYIVKPGWSIDIDLDDFSGACDFDIRAEFEDGYVLEEWNINVCEISEYKYEPTYY